jgi:two-component system, cell cycle sensor histidine kinase and response regulator CckA
MAPLPRPTVLLADDEQPVRQLMARILEGAGWRVLQAENGAAALQVADLMDGGLKLVVTDINMPVMDGLEFAKAFRALHPTVPIVFVTGKTTTTITSLCDTDGRATVLGKPFTGETLLHIVSQALHGSSPPAPT